jgi:hypothetical protein
MFKQYESESNGMSQKVIGLNPTVNQALQLIGGNAMNTQQSLKASQDKFTSMMK